VTGFSGAYDQDLAVAQVSESPGGHLDGDGADRKGIAADAGLLSDPASGAHCLPEQSEERKSDNAARLGRFKGRADLTQYLVFTEYQGVQACGYAEKVAHRIFVLEVVQMRGKLFSGKATLRAQETHRAVHAFPVVVGGQVQLGAVAGRKHDPLGDVVVQFHHGRLQPSRRQRDPLPDCHRRRFVVNAQ